MGYYLNLTIDEPSRYPPITDMFPYLAYPTINPGIFPDSYTSARQDFLKWAELASNANGELVAFQCPGEGQDGQYLYTDALRLGCENAANVLVLLSGTHGIEGFVGSAIQFDILQLLASGEICIPAETSILMVHALTPWGYSWLRRCDKDGVDLNRNAVDFSRPLPKNPGYETLRNALFSSDSKERMRLFADLEMQNGRTALEIAISGGQYTDPSGPFYGGHKAAHGRIVTENLIQQFTLQKRNLAVIDLHSGLGPYGYGEIICDHAPDSPGTRVAQSWFGDSVTLPGLGTSSSVPKSGLIDYIWHGIMNSRSCYVTLEFGTYATDQLFEVLLKDHQLWAEEGNNPERLAHSLQMRRHFCPDDAAWKAMVLFRGRQIVAQALTGLKEN